MLIRQPNGLLCRFDEDNNRIERYNLTEEDFKKLYIEEAIEQAKKEADEIVKNYVRDYFDLVENDIPENILKDMREIRKPL